MKKAIVFMAALAASLFVCAGESAPGSNGVFCVRDFGAKGDGTTKDTAAIQAAVDAANAAGGGEVLLPAGRYVSGSIFLKSNVDFHFAADGIGWVAGAR